MIATFIGLALLVGKLENPQNTFPNVLGTTGVLRSISAVPNKPTSFGASFIANFFSQDPFIDGLKSSRNQFRVSGNYTFDWGLPIEVFGGTTITYTDNSSSTSAKTMTTYFENTDIGAKLGYPLFTEHFYVGAFAHLRLFSGTRAPRNTSGGAVESSGPLVSGAIGINSTLDFSKFESFPVRQHLQIAYRLPNGDKNSAPDEFNRFALDSFKYSAIIGTIGLELPYKYVTPFVEYSMEYAYATGGDSVSNKDNRQKMTAGARFTPFESFGLIAALDYGFKGPGSGAAVGIPRNPQTDFFIGLNFQALGESLLQKYGTMRGNITDEKGGTPLAGVKIVLINSTLPPATTDGNGAFHFDRLENGTYQLQAEKEGYDTLTKSVTIRDGGDALSDLTMKVTGPKMGSLDISVVDAETQQAVSGAVIKVGGSPTNFSTNEGGRINIPSLVEGQKDITVEAPGYETQSISVDVLPNNANSQTVNLIKAAPTTGICAGIVNNPDGTPLTAVFKSEDNNLPTFGTDPITGAFQQSLPVGSHRFRVQAENYLPQVVICEVTASGGGQMTVTLAKPKEAIVVDDKIVLPDAIYFDFGKASIKKESHSILDQVAAILIKEKNYKTLNIEGHTDDIGSDKSNQKLSEARAKSVKRYLTLKGVSAKKLEAIGYGESKAVSTNLTPEGRSENRRVEFNLIRE